MRKFCQTSVSGFVLSLLLCAAAAAQNIITPDDTLGDETSRVEVFDAGIDLITGGATREQNLFHSFEAFNVSEAAGVYFITESDAITNIFTRITGDNISEIRGILGTRQRSEGIFSITNADLFLINPNGFIFTDNATLDVGGSFTASTASGVAFGDAGSFSTANPEIVSSQLTVNPSVYLFEQGKLGNITGRLAQTNNGEGLPRGLLVPDGETISLLASNVSLSGFGLYAPGGRIIIEAADSIQVAEQSRIDVGVGGSIDIKTDSFEISDRSFLLAGFSLGGFSTSPPENRGRGNISVFAQTVKAFDASIIGSFVDFSDSTFSGGANILVSADSLLFLDGSRLISDSFGLGDSGDIRVFTANEAVFEGTSTEGSSSGIFSTVQPSGTGNGGSILLLAGSLNVANGARITAATFGSGNAGVITLRVKQTARFAGASPDGSLLSGAFTSVETDGAGRGGDLSIDAGRLEVIDGAQLSAANLGIGDAGNVRLLIEDRLTSRDGTISTASFIGSGGSVDIMSRGIVLLGDSDITTAIEQGIGTSSGSISIDGKFIIAFDDSDFIASTTNGAGGNITFNDTAIFIDTQQLSRSEANVETLDRNNRVDIAASGQASQVEVGSPIESANDLPVDNSLATENIVARSCIDRRGRATGSLTVSGSAGTPQQPDEAQSVYATGTVRTALESSTAFTFQEPEDVYQLADGRLVLSRSCQD